MKNDFNGQNTGPEGEDTSRSEWLIYSFVLAVVALAVAVSLAWVFWGDRETQQSEDRAAQTDEEQVQQVGFSKNWQTYRNEQEGIEFKYPQAWERTEEQQSSGSGTTTRFRNADGVYVLTMNTPIREIGYQTHELVETDEVSVMDGEGTVTKRVFEARANAANDLIIVSWNQDDWKNSGEIIAHYPPGEDRARVEETLGRILQTLRIGQSDSGQRSNVQTSGLITDWRDAPVDLTKCDATPPHWTSERERTEIDMGNDVFSFPQGGEEYKKGDEMTIRWDPEKIDVSTISFFPADNEYNNCFHVSGLGNVYRRESLDDPVSTTGEYTHTLSDQLFPGEYHVVLSTWGQAYGRERRVLSNPIHIQPSEPVPPPVAGFTMELAESRSADEPIFPVHVKVQDANGERITREDGFRMTGRVVYAAADEQVARIDGTYSPQKDLWVVNTPENYSEFESGRYLITITMWCSNSRKVCADKFTTSSEQEEMELIFDVR